MRLGWMRIDLLIPMAHSLKEKRRPLKSLMEKLRNRFNASVAEVDCQDLHQRAVMGVAIVASDGKGLAALMRSIREFVMSNPDCRVLDVKEETLGWQS